MRHPEPLARERQPSWRLVWGLDGLGHWIPGLLVRWTWHTDPQLEQRGWLATVHYYTPEGQQRSFQTWRVEPIHSEPPPPEDPIPIRTGPSRRQPGDNTGRAYPYSKWD